MSRTVVTVRIPPVLLKQIDKRTAQHREELGASWSRNDEILYMLNQVVEGRERHEHV